MSPARAIGLLLVCGSLGCATASVSGKFPSPAPPGAGAMHVLVLPAGSARNLSTGNEGFSFVDAQRLVDEQVLAVAREKDPNAALAPADSERNAAGYARAHGATHLLVPTILEWRQMRSDDPVGAFTEPHNRIVIELRLVRLDSTTTVGDVTFTNHARLTVNQSAERLLDEEFKKTVKRLLG